MNKSESINELATALAKAQAEFPEIPKDKEVKAGSFTYRYADLASIIRATRPALAKHGLATSQLFGSQDSKGVITTMLMHSSGQFIADTVSFNLANKMQEVGSSITYLRRYSVSAILGVASDDDTDGHTEGVQTKTVERAKPVAQQQQQQQQQQTKPNTNSDSGSERVDPNAITAAQIAKIFAMATELHITANAAKALMYERYKKDSTKLLTKKEASDFIEYLSRDSMEQT